MRLFEALGKPQRTEIELYANINRGTLDRSPDAFAARATAAVAGGFDAIKIAPFDELRADQTDKAERQKAMTAGLARIAAVRTAIGTDGDCSSTVIGA